MNLNLQLTEHPFVFDLINEKGVKTTIDASEKIGGKNKGLRPMELLAGSLAACIAIDLLNILRKKRIEIRTFKIEIVGQRQDAVPAAFEQILLRIGIDKTIDRVVVKKAAQLVVDKYCSVAASLDKNIKIELEIKEN